MDERREQLMAEIDRQDRAGDYTKLLPLTTEYSQLVAEKYGVKSMEYAAALNDLGGIYRDIGGYEKAEELFNQGNEVLAVLRGRQDPNYATSINNTAGLYRLMKKWTESEALFLEAIEIYKMTLGEEHFLLISALNNLGLLYQDMERYDEAEPLHQRCRTLLEKSNDNAIGLATTLNNLATLAQKTGRAKEASRFLEQALAIYKENLGAEHPLYATAINTLAMSRYHSGDNIGAEKAFLEVEEIIRRRFGAGSSYHKSSLGNLAHIYKVMGDDEKAKRYLSEAAMNRKVQENSDEGT